MHRFSFPTPAAALLLAAATLTSAADLGDVRNEWTAVPTLPSAADRVDPARVLATVRAHIAEVQARDPAAAPALTGWLREYQQVLGAHPELSRPLPNLTKEGSVSRYLVGFVLGDAVAGFYPVSPDGLRVQGELLWGQDGEPLWKVPRSTWEAAASVGDVPELAELVAWTPAFTMGIPVDPTQEPGLTFVEGSLDALPYKVQEERQAWLDYLNRERSPVRELKATIGRRTGSSKCLSVAASYAADWWAVRVGRPLPRYINGIGGQIEYGFNPRELESLFYKRNKEESGPLSWDFKTAPFGKDRVTGERIPYSVRSYARILTETRAQRLRDSVVPDKVYEVGENPFAMDEAPRYLFKRAGGSQEAIARALETWGPLLAQHTMRNKKGKPIRYVGVHAVLLVGHGTLRDGREVLAYRESFGNFDAGYLEDSFGGPKLRALPREHTYQAIAFPHRLLLRAEAVTDAAGRARVRVEVATNRGADPVDPDLWRVEVDGAAVAATPRRTETGRYELEVQVPADTPTTTLRIQASRRYFADRDGHAVFEASLPLSVATTSRSDDPANEIRAQDPAEAAAEWAADVSGELVHLVAQGRAEEAAASVREMTAKVPGLRRLLLAKLLELYRDGRRIPAPLRAALGA